MTIPIIFSNVSFGINYEQLKNILFYITDEFPNLVYDVDSTIQSSLIKSENQSFIVTFSEQGDTLHDLGVLYYLEPKIFSLIEFVDSQLRAYDLYVSASDFGSSDIYYELVISKIGHTPEFLPRYSKTLENATATAAVDGSGDVSNPSVSSTSVSASISGSGDRTTVLKDRLKQKMGDPTQVSDLRFLKGVKLKRVKDF
jgi:hypothetical protein